MTEAETLLAWLETVHRRQAVAAHGGGPVAIEPEAGASDTDRMAALEADGLVSRVPGNGHFYLTHAGLCELARLGYFQLVGRLERYYRKRQLLRCELAELVHLGVRTLAFYGGGLAAEAGHGAISGLPLRLVAVTSEHRAQVNFYQYRLEPPEILPRLNPDRILLSGDGPVEPMKERLSRLGIDESRFLVPPA